MTGYSHRSGQELVAQGVANIASALFGGLPATGAIARTATNIRKTSSSCEWNSCPISIRAARDPSQTI
jgi:SulP family sulfate permease